MYTLWMFINYEFGSGKFKGFKFTLSGIRWLFVCMHAIAVYRSYLFFFLHLSYTFQLIWWFTSLTFQSFVLLKDNYKTHISFKVQHCLFNLPHPNFVQWTPIIRNRVFRFSFQNRIMFFLLLKKCLRKWHSMIDGFYIFFCKTQLAY